MHYIPVCLCHSFTLTLQCRQEIYAVLEQEIQYSDNCSCHDRDADNRNGLFKKRILVRPCNLLKFSLQTFKKARFRRLICLCGTSHVLLLSTTARTTLFRFLMHRMLPAEFAIFPRLHPFRVFLLVFRRIVVTLFAFRTCQCDSCAHLNTSTCITIRCFISLIF